MKRWLCFVFAFILISTGIVAAEDNNLTPWPIVQRCLPTPITPDKTWSYNGEILMTGWAGIHGVNVRSTVPYVLHWGRGDDLLSPNGQWILSQFVHSITVPLTGGGPMGIYVTDYGAITAENLTTGEKIKFPWQAHTDISSGPYPVPPAGPIWLDNEHFISFYDWNGSKTKEGNLETGEIKDRPDVDLSDYEYSISPDQTRYTSFGTLYNRLNNQVMAQIQVGTPYDMVSSVWAQDSSKFADFTPSENNTITLSIFDRDGNLIAKLFSKTGYMRLGKFSSSNNYFWFTPEGVNNPYILDMRKKVIYDLCINKSHSLAWSPDETQFATILGEGQQPIIVVDMDTWQPHIVGYHDGSVLLWRSLP